METAYFLLRSFQFRKVSLYFPLSIGILFDLNLIASKKHRLTAKFQTFCRQMYHTCLDRIFAPLKDGMSVAEVVKCPDGHFRRAVYGIGPYIADYPEQVWLSAIVQGWCPKWVYIYNETAYAYCLRLSISDVARSPRTWTHRVLIGENKKQPTTFIIIGILVCCGLISEFARTLRHVSLLNMPTSIILTNVLQPFTHDFPRADIHEILTPDLLHQVIKGTFKDHLVAWVNAYLYEMHGKSRANAIIEDIDRRCVAHLFLLDMNLNFEEYPPSLPSQDCGAFQMAVISSSGRAMTLKL
jgi:hypothetical protein